MDTEQDILITQLKELLQFAYRNLSISAYEPDDAEFEFCVVCGKPEWNHDENCAGTKWKNDTKKILEEK